MIETGIKGHAEQTVTPDLTASAVGSGLVNVYATPMMVALMEQTCHASIASHLKEGQTSVGIHINVSHKNPTPVGMRVWCDSVLEVIDRRRLLFSVTAYDERGVIGSGTHERCIVDQAQFQAKALNTEA